MKHVWLCCFLLIPFLTGCGGDKPKDPYAEWFSAPTKVVEGIMFAYETRNDSLFASFLAEDFRYYFEPEGADSLDILGWGKEEEVVGTGSLFKTSDVENLDYSLDYGQPRSAEGAGRDGWMVIPVSGGRMVISVTDKEPVNVVLNRQEIVLRPTGSENSTRRWEIIEWHDYPAPLELEGGE